MVLQARILMGGSGERSENSQGSLFLQRRWRVLSRCRDWTRLIWVRDRLKSRFAG